MRLPRPGPDGILLVRRRLTPKRAEKLRRQWQQQWYTPSELRAIENLPRSRSVLRSPGLWLVVLIVLSYVLLAVALTELGGTFGG